MKYTKRLEDPGHDIHSVVYDIVYDYSEANPNEELARVFQYLSHVKHEMNRANSGIQIYDLVAHLYRQGNFSFETFGPGKRVMGVTDHIKKELAEVIESDGALSEWVDVILLALDGAWRSGANPEKICQTLDAKLKINQNRTWPDWRTSDPDKAIEHDRSVGAE